MYIATTLPLEVFTQRNFVADFYWQTLNFSGKTAKSRFVPPFGGIRGNAHGSSMAPFSTNYFFRQPSRLSRHERILVYIVVFEREWVSLSANFRGHRGLPTNDCWQQKTKVPGLSRGTVCVILCLAILTQYQRVTDTQTHDDR